MSNVSGVRVVGFAAVAAALSIGCSSTEPDLLSGPPVVPPVAGNQTPTQPRQTFSGRGQFSNSVAFSTPVTGEFSETNRLTVSTGGGPQPSITNAPLVANTEADPVFSPASKYANGGDTAFIFRQLGTAALVDSHVGFLQSSANGTTQSGFYYAGSPTPVTSLPAGTATYNGGFVGTVNDGTGLNGRATGNAQIVANFGNGSFGGTISNVRVTNNANALQNSNIGVSMFGQLTGNTYQGSAVITSPGNVVTPGTNLVIGGIMGPTGGETAGVIRSEATVNGAPASVNGGFGAKR